MKRLICVIALLLVAGCGPTPTPTPAPTTTRTATRTPLPAATRVPSATPTVDPQYAMRLLCTSTVLDNRNPLPGRIARFQPPVAINAHNIPRVLDAIKDIEARTGGLVTFTVVAADPAIGITVVEGDAVDINGGPGCGNVTSASDPRSGHRYRADSAGVFNSLVYVHLGSAGCNDGRTGYRPYSIAAHEIAHALGIGRHFAGFNGNEGISAEAAAVLTLLYGTPLGADMSASCPK